MIIIPETGYTEDVEIRIQKYYDAKKIKRIKVRGRDVFIAFGYSDDTIADKLNEYEHVDLALNKSNGYFLVSNRFSSKPTTVNVGSLTIGGGSFTVMAGPCAIESYQSLKEIAAAVKLGGADILRAGAFKPRTSPYSFQGMGKEGLEILSDIRTHFSIPVVCEVTDSSYLPFYENVDILQIGAKNMQNFELLKAAASYKKPILLKRGFGCTVEELLASAEYLITNGNDRIILCERGIRTFEGATRFTLDLSAVGILKRQSHLPVIVDPSHASGEPEIAGRLMLAAAAAGADGVITEVHSKPECALCDGNQAMLPEDFSILCAKARKIHDIITE